MTPTPSTPSKEQVQELRPEIHRLEEVAYRLRPPARSLNSLALALLLVGFAGFGIGWWLAPNRMWAAMLVNVNFWVGLCQAAVVVAALFNVVVARWGRIVERSVAGLGAFMPFTWIPSAALWFGRERLWVFIHDTHRNGWFEIGRLFWREGTMLFVMIVLSVCYLYVSIRPDLGALKERGEPQDRFQAWVTRGWKGLEQERLRSQRVLRTLAPVLIVMYGFGYSMWAVDLGEILYPRWKSTMYGGLYWESELYAALAVTAVLVSAWRRYDEVGRIIIPRRLLDLGNLTWGFGMLWAYFAWAQYLVIWMGNRPEQAHYIIQEWRTWPWTGFAWTALALIFILPFCLSFARGLKESPTGLACIGAIAALGVLAYRYLDVMPFIPNLESGVFWIIELMITLGFAGAVGLCYHWLMRRVPIFPVEDPLFEEALETAGVKG